ncbi:MAG: tetratricopeptide repeat protein [Campylobacterales bacterium]|nr:tetratricopeptide repeat protein [Campylobacterales bacterium]
MSTFAIIMLAATAFFAYQIYQHVNTLEDKEDGKAEPITPIVEFKPSMSATDLLVEADEAYSEGDLERALDKLMKANILFPNTAEIVNKLAFVNGKLGNTQKAIELYQHSLELDGNDDLTHNAIASMYKTEGSLLLAKEHYEKALQIDDEYAVTYYNYGNLLVELGKHEEAKTMYDRALSLQEEFPEAREALENLKGRE